MQEKRLLKKEKPNDFISIMQRLKDWKNPEKIERLLKSEIMNVLKNYFDITSEDVSLSILINDDGKYDLQINAISSFLKIAHTF